MSAHVLQIISCNNHFCISACEGPRLNQIKPLAMKNTTKTKNLDAEIHSAWVVSFLIPLSLSHKQTNRASKQGNKQPHTNKPRSKETNKQTHTHTQTNKHTGHKQTNKPTNEATRKRTIQHKRIWRLSFSFGLSFVSTSPLSCKHNAQIMRLVIRPSMPSYQHVDDVCVSS